MNPDVEAKLARICELIAQREEINQKLIAILTDRTALVEEAKPAPRQARRITNKGRKIASPPRIAKRDYRRADVERDIVGGEKAATIAEKHGIEPSTVYQIKHEMRKAGALLPNPIRRADQSSTPSTASKPASRRGRPRKDPLISHSNRVAVSLNDDEDADGAYDLDAFGDDDN